MFKRRRGLFKGVVLYLLKSKPLSGYEILKELSRLTSGKFVPSPGTLYPLLSYMEAEGLIEARESYVGRRRKKIYALTAAGEEHLAKLMDDEEFRSIIQMLEGGGREGDLLAAVRDELVYIDEVFDEIEGNDAEVLKEMLALLKRLEEKVEARLKKGAGRLSFCVFMRYFYAVYVIYVERRVFESEEFLAAFSADNMFHVPLIPLNCEVVGNLLWNFHVITYNYFLK
ncbi:MAG: PadR family transcriptional regulator [Pyrobaculum sp.]